MWSLYVHSRTTAWQPIGNNVNTKTKNVYKILWTTATKYSVSEAGVTLFIIINEKISKHCKFLRTPRLKHNSSDPVVSLLLISDFSNHLKPIRKPNTLFNYVTTRCCITQFEIPQLFKIILMFTIYYKPVNK